jgi:hypothetical protein
MPRFFFPSITSDKDLPCHFIVKCPRFWWTFKVVNNNMKVGNAPHKLTTIARHSFTGTAALACAIIAGWYATDAIAKSPRWELVPPPPPTPVLQIPPAPVMLPYTYAQDGSAPLPLAILSQPSPPTTPHPIGQPPRPQPQPRPTGVRPANAPNLSVAYAKSRGFGTPRFSYNSNDGPGAAEAFPSIPAAGPVNTWFDSSLRWYAQHVNSQRFYSELANQHQYDGTPAAYATASAPYNDALPGWYERLGSSAGAANAAPHKSSSSGRYQRHRRGHHRVVAYR